MYLCTTTSKRRITAYGFAQGVVNVTTISTTQRPGLAVWPYVQRR